MVGRTPAVQLAPGVWRVPTAPADLINTFNAREVVRGFLNELAGAP